MGWINGEEAAFYAAVWSVGFLSSVFVFLGEPTGKHRSLCIYRGGIAGFLAFATVAIFVGRVSEPISGHWYYLGIAALIGLSSRQSEALRKRLFEFVLKKRIVFLTDKEDADARSKKGDGD